MAFRSLPLLAFLSTACGGGPAQSAATPAPPQAASTSHAAATIASSRTPVATLVATAETVVAAAAAVAPTAVESHKASESGVRVRLATPSSLGVMVAVDFPSPVRRVAFRGAASTEWTPALGSPETLTATALVALRKSDIVKGRAHFLIRATKADGSALADTALEFDAEASRMQTAKDTLNAMPTMWVGVKLQPPSTLVYFTGSIVYKPVLSAIRYQLNDSTEVRAVRFAPGDETGVAAEDELFTTVAGTVSSVTIELFYKDGTTSGKRRLLVSDITLR